MKKILVIIAILITAVFAFGLVKNQSIAQSGCCSYHGGVCGCSYGNVKCCDGSLSPSCRCLKDDKTGQCIAQNHQ